MQQQYSYESEWKPYAFPEDRQHLATEQELEERYTRVSLTIESEGTSGNIPAHSTARIPAHSAAGTPAHSTAGIPARAASVMSAPAAFGTLARAADRTSTSAASVMSALPAADTHSLPTGGTPAFPGGDTTALPTGGTPALPGGDTTTLPTAAHPALPAGGMPVLSDGKTAVINTGNEMTIVYGATGTKKSRILISTLTAILALAGESMIIPDIKGELSSGVFAPKILGILKEQSYNIRILNFRTMDQDGFNLLGTAYEKYRSGKKAEAMTELHNLIDRLASIYKGSISDPIWEKSAKEYLMAVAVLMFEYCKDSGMVNLLSLASYTDRESCSRMERIASMIDSDNNIMTMLRSVLSEPEKTRMSTLATVGSFFADLIINEKLLRMISTSTFNLEELYEQKTALFLVLPDETDACSSVTGLILSQISTFLVEKAYEFRGQLPRRVNYICDEFCNYYIPGMERNISAHRSRNIRWYLVCQGKKQLMSAYPKEYGTILSNCTNIYFLGSPETELLEELSERAGYTNVSEDGKPKPLLSVGNLRSLKKGREYSEVYFSDGSLTCVTLLPDIDQYEFLQKFTEEPPQQPGKNPPRVAPVQSSRVAPVQSPRVAPVQSPRVAPFRTFPELPVYSAEQMLRDVYDRRNER